MGLVAPWHVGSSQTRDHTHVPCTGRPMTSLSCKGSRWRCWQLSLSVPPWALRRLCRDLQRPLGVCYWLAPARLFEQAGCPMHSGCWVGILCLIVPKLPETGRFRRLLWRLQVLCVLPDLKACLIGQTVSVEVNWWESLFPRWWRSFQNASSIGTGQKIHSGFPSYLTEKSEKNFLANPVLTVTQLSFHL